MTMEQYIGESITRAIDKHTGKTGQLLEEATFEFAANMCDYLTVAIRLADSLGITLDELFGHKTTAITNSQLKTKAFMKYLVDRNTNEEEALFEVMKVMMEE